MEKDCVLVTGAGSYIGLQIVLQLLEEGYPVRGTIRDLRREPHLREVLSRHTSAGDCLELFQADLTADSGWDAAFEGVDYVMHVASPFRVVSKKDEDELIIPAVEGTRRVLRFAADARARRVVLTSSMAAVMSGYRDNGRRFDESDWTEITPELDPYTKSKTLAEQAAWDFIRQLPPERSLELTVINPTFVFGPFLDETFDGSSTILLKNLLKRAYPANPAFDFGVVDVRDVAQAHLAAMITPEAAGQRFCCQAGTLWMHEIAEILNKNFAARGYPVRTARLPDIAVRVTALFDPNIRALIGTLGKRNHIDSSKIRAMLNWNPRPIEQTIVETAESMIDLKMI